MNRHRSVTFLRWLSIITLVLLVIQYVLGMIVNLYTSFPDNLPSGNAWAWVMGNSTLVKTHVILGTLLVLVTLGMMIVAIRGRRTGSIILGILGFLVIVFTWMSGDEFLVHSQQNGSSIMMAIGCIVAVVIYSGNLLAIRHDEP